MAGFGIVVLRFNFPLFDVPLFIPVRRNKNLPPQADLHLRLGKLQGMFPVTENPCASGDETTSEVGSFDVPLKWVKNNFFGEKSARIIL